MSPIALVTGGGSGIGAACARRLAADGHLVWVADLDAAAAVLVAKEITESGGRAEGRELDVASPDSVAAVVEDCLALHRRLDVTVNCAGVLGPLAPLADCPEDGFEQVMRVNVFGAFHVLRHSLRAMAETGGVIVTIASVAATNAPHSMGAYAATKSAVRSLTRSAAQEYAHAGVRVVSVSPGPVRTPMTAALPQDQLAASTPLGTMADPADIAAAVSFLVSSEAWYITGSDHPVDGGMLSRGEVVNSSRV